MTDKSYNTQERLEFEAKSYDVLCKEGNNLDLEKLFQLCKTQSEAIENAPSQEEAVQVLQEAIEKWMFISLEATRRGHVMKDRYDDVYEKLDGSIKAFYEKQNLVFGENPPYIKLLEHLMGLESFSAFSVFFYDNYAKDASSVCKRFNEILEQHPVSLPFSYYYTKEGDVKTILRLRGEFLKYEEYELLDIFYGENILDDKQKIKFFTKFQVFHKNINAVEEMIENLDQATDNAEKVIERATASKKILYGLLEAIVQEKYAQ